MEPVTFQCGSCNELMAVSSEYLGQQVQCPHCQQIVVAPGSQSAPEPEASAQTSDVQLDDSDYEDIFTPPSEEDDVFGDNEEVPRLEIPDHPQHPASHQAQTLDDPQNNELATSAGEGQLTEVPLMDLAHSEATTAPASTDAPGYQPPVDEQAETVDAAPTPWMDDQHSPVSGTEGMGEPSSPATRRARGGGGGMLMTLLIFPLVSYSILATVLLVVLYSRFKTVQSNELKWLEEMPDVNGDTPGVKQSGQTRRDFKVPRATVVNKVPLPEGLRVGLNETLQIGDLEVTPLSVERKRMNIFVEGFQGRPEPLIADSLVLNLQLKNTSTEYAFAPLDHYFNRLFEGGTPPLTVLEAGKRAKFVGGPARWRRKDSMPSVKENAARREWVEGHRPVLPYLQPGETMTTFICTDGTEELQDILSDYNGDYLWRIWVRRGVVAVEGRDAPVPATALVGVTFRSKDIGNGPQQPEPAGAD